MKLFNLFCWVTIPLLSTAQNTLDNFILQSLSNTDTVIGDAGDFVYSPVDLDFHPEFGRQNELWVVNQQDESSGGHTVTFLDAGLPAQTSVYKKDGNAWHFMSLSTSIAFSDNGNWATAQGVQDANHSGGIFTGPTLWPSDLSLYGVIGNPPTPTVNGSHLDMLHQSPYGMGIAHEADNVFWVFDGWNRNIVRYDFGFPHGLGGSDHSDGRIVRFANVDVKKDASGAPSHLVLDKNTGWLYIVDGGNDRILRMDINTGTKGTAFPAVPETLAEYKEVNDATWEVFASTGLVRPCGIEISGDRLLVTDNATGDIILYDLTQPNGTEVGRINTAAGIMGIKVGPDGQIWYVNRSNQQVVRLSNPYVQPPVGEAMTKQAWALNIFPNPTAGAAWISGLPANGNSMIEIYSTLGEKVLSLTPAAGAGSYPLDLSGLTSGSYHIRLIHAGGEVTRGSVTLVR